MNIIVRNKAKVPNKYIRFAKWKLRNVQEKFDQMLYAKLYVTSEGSRSTLYQTTFILGVPGHDIILKHRSEDLKSLLAESLDKVAISIRRYKDKRDEKSRIDLTGR